MMNKQCEAVGGNAANVEVHLVRRVMIFSGLLTAVLAFGGWYIAGWCFSRSVLIGGMPAARMGDMTAHGGSIAAGLPTVLIGDAGSAQSNALKGAAANGAALAEHCPG